MVFEYRCLAFTTTFIVIGTRTHVVLCVAIKLLYIRGIRKGIILYDWLRICNHSGSDGRNGSVDAHVNVEWFTIPIIIRIKDLSNLTNERRPTFKPSLLHNTSCQCERSFETYIKLFRVRWDINNFTIHESWISRRHAQPWCASVWGHKSRTRCIVIIVHQRFLCHQVGSTILIQYRCHDNLLQYAYP